MIDEIAAARHIDALQDARLIAVDTETTGLKVEDGTDYLMGISVAYSLGDLGIVSTYFPFRHSDENLPKEYLYRLQAILEEKPLIFHNIKFDLHALSTIGIRPHGRLFCTVEIAHWINEEWPLNKKLENLSQIFLKEGKDTTEIDDWIKAFGWPTIPAQMMHKYASKDAELTYRLFELFYPQLKQQSLDEPWPTEVAFTKVLCSMESTGIRVDLDFCKRKIAQGENRMLDIEYELDFTPTKPTELGPFLFDVLKLPCIAYTKEGRPCFDKDAMEQYDEMLAVSGSPAAKLVLEYRGWQKAVSSLYSTCIELVSHDGRIRPHFNQHGTKTGRLSCSKPNLQQIPRNSSKEWNGDAALAFIAEDGYGLWNFDYSQLEYRLGAVYGNETELLAIFEKGDDPFLPTATTVFGGPEFRQSAKTLTYSILYNAGINRIKNALGLDTDTATAVRQKFRDLYPGIFTASEQSARLMAQRGYVRYWTGRRRHIKSKEHAYKAFNSVIQGGSAELVKRAIIRVYDELVDGTICRMVLTVHDSIVLEIKDGYEEDIIRRATKLMTDFPEIKVKLDVEVKRWGT